MSDPSPNRGWVAAGALVATVVALAVRLPGLSHGYSTDETGTLTPGGWFAQLFDPESGVNPPLWRWLLTFFPPGQELDGGRLVALVASVLAVPVVAFTSARLSGRAVGAWIGGLALALHLPSIWAASTARVYGPWSLVLALHVLLVVRWTEAPGRGRAAGVMLTAALLPWIHYAAVPWLLVAGLLAMAWPATRRLPLLYAPAALAFLPLAERIWLSPDRRVPPSRTLGETANLVVSAGLDWTRSLQLTPGAPSLPGNPSLAAATVIVVGLGAAWMARRRGAMAGWMVGAAALFVAVTLFFAPFQSVRPPMAAPFMVLLAPLLAAWVGWPTTLWQRGVGLGVVGLGLGLPLGMMARMPATEVLERDAIREIAQAMREGRWEATDLVVTPRQHVVSFAYLLTGAYVSNAPPCPGEVDCVELAGIQMRARDRVTHPEARWILVVGNPVPKLEGCAPQPSHPGTTLLDCGP